MAGCRVKTGGRATVLRYTDRELVLEWEKGGRERFTRKAQAGVYILKRASGGRGRRMPEWERGRVGLPTAALAAPEVRWCVCAVALPRESWYWLRDWIEFHLRAGASLVAIYDNTGSTGGLRGDSLFCGGKLQREGRSKRGEEYGRLTAHLSDGDIQKGLHGLAARYGEERVKDFYDIRFLSQQFEFDTFTLSEAIGRTFTHRKTDPDSARSLFTEEFVVSRQVQWKAFFLWFVFPEWARMRADKRKFDKGGAVCEIMCNKPPPLSLLVR